MLCSLKKIEFFVTNYLKLIQKHPFIPSFVISELNRNPQMLIKIFEKNVQFQNDNLFKLFQSQVDSEVKEGIIKPIDVKNLMTNIIGLCIFPIVARPIIQGIMFDNNKKEYDTFLAQRKDFVTDFIINSIKA